VYPWSAWARRSMVAFTRPGSPRQYPRIDCTCPRGSGKGNLRSRLDLPLERSMADTAEIVVIGASHGNREQVPLVQLAEK
jgi:hypothetical protein